MSLRSQHRELLRSLRERKRAHLTRRAYPSVYRAVAHLVPVVLPLVGRMQAYPLTAPAREVLDRLARQSVLCFETALEAWKGRRLLTARDLHAYTTDANLAESLPGLGPECVPPDLTPIFPRDPHLFLWVLQAWPEHVELEGVRVVTAERLLREYLGTVGQRFDLLAVLVHLLG